MNCTEFRVHLHPYVDGEFGAGETAAADAHVAECPACRSRVTREREFRQLLRRQPRESAPPEFRARILAEVRRSARRAVLRPWLIAPAAAIAAAALLVLSLLPVMRPGAPLMSELVDKHIAYAQVENPAEFASSDRRAVEAWFRERAGLRVTAADYSPAGIRLVGARIAEANERKAAYVLYEKGHTLLSVFMVPASAAGTELKGTRVPYGGHEYITAERKGYRTVSWTDGQTVYGLVSLLDYDALLECADRLRAERARDARL